MVVGIDNDKSISISKGPGRSFYNLKQRLKVLNEVESIDYIFTINSSYNFSSFKAQLAHKRILMTLKPDFLVTNIMADKYCNRKKRICEEAGVVLIREKRERTSSTTQIANKLQAEI